MEESKKNPIMIGVIVVCLAAACTISLIWSSGTPTGIDTIDPKKMTWVKCRNPSCEAEYQMRLKEYCRQVEENMDYSSGAMALPALVCKECKDKSIFEAAKCRKCELVFEKGWKRGDYEDRCPECGYSQIEKDREERARGGSAGGKAQRYKR